MPKLKPVAVLQLIHLPAIEMPKVPEVTSLHTEKDELNSYLLPFELYAENAKSEKNMWAIHLSALLRGRAVDVYTISDVPWRLQQLKEGTLNQVQFHQKMATERDSGRSSQRLKKRQTGSSSV